jgi:hypothetical protein
MSEAKKGIKHSKELREKMALSLLENRQKKGINTFRNYCNAWGDKEYVNSLRKEGCEHCGVTSMMSLKLWGEVLSIHHKNGKKECAPNDVATLCKSCHTKEEAKLRKKAV